MTRHTLVRLTAASIALAACTALHPTAAASASPDKVDRFRLVPALSATFAPQTCKMKITGPVCERQLLDEKRTRGTIHTEKSGVTREHHPGDRAAYRPLVWVRYTPATDSAALVAGRLDGGQQRQLTHPEPGLRDAEPVRSPDGTRVIFHREFPNGTVRIGIVPIRGGPTRFIETGCQDPCFSDQGPAWTPDGNRLTFVRVMGPFDPVTGDAASALQYTERLDGTDLRLLSVPGDYEDNTVRFSPDGSYMVFTRDQTVDSVLHFAIFRMRSDSTHVRQLTPWDLDADRPAVSPARSGPTAGLISFETHGGGHPTQGDVALLPASCPTIEACTDATRLVTHNTGTTRTSYAASWSPTGHRLAFAQEDGTGNVDIYTIRPDGRHQRQVTHLPAPEYSPAWSY